MSTKITITLDPNDLKRILQKGIKVEKNLTLKQGEVFKYAFKVADGYRRAVLSGIGKTTTGVLSLKEFLGTVETTHWEPLSGLTTNYKQEMGWSLEIWKASGAVSDVMGSSSNSIIVSKSSTGIDLFAGIDGTKFREAFEHAYRAEYGGYAEPYPPNSGNWDGRALFTLLNIILKDKAEVVFAGLREAIAKEIAKTWG